jgi:hypothetical protein
MARAKRRSSLKNAASTSTSTASSKSREADDPWKTFVEMMTYINTHILNLNQNKVFAGVVIIVLNISSKFVTIKLSKSMEAYLKYTFSRSILIFAMAWMGTRDIYTALFITLLFGLCANYLFNEESAYCCLPESFTSYHEGLSENTSPQVTPQQIDDAIKVLSDAKAQLSNTKTP